MIKIKQYVLVLIAILLTIPSTADGAVTREQSIKNIETFAGLYGYVKYFYPGDEAAATDWDRFAVYGIKKTAAASGNEELKQILDELFLPIAPGLVIHFTKEKKTFSPSSLTPPGKKKMKVTAWQHMGLGGHAASGGYESLRLNRKDESKKSTGIFTTCFEASPYRGKEIKFKAAVKMSQHAIKSGGKGYLWLRIDRKNRKKGFFDNMNNRPIQSTDWTYYEITGKVADDAVNICCGGFHAGDGGLWVDDFQLMVKEKDGWKPAELKNPGFENDKDGEKPGDWFTSGTCSFEVTTAHKTKGLQCLSVHASASRELFKRKPAFGESISKKLGSGLSCIMPIALYTSEKYTFPQSPAKSVASLKEAVKKETPAELTGNDLHVRLADIVIGWNAFRHFFPYFDVINTDWQAALTKALGNAYKDRNHDDFLETLQLFTAELKDCHVRVKYKGNDKPKHFIPIYWEWIEGQIVVTDIFDESLTNLKKGDVVREINGKNAALLLENKEKYTSAATKGWKQFRALTELLASEDSTPVKLKIKRENDAPFEVILTPIKGSPLTNFRKKNGNIKSKEIKEGIHYLNLSLISMAEIYELMPQLEKAKGIICDLRGYPNGNDGLICHLLKKDDTSNGWMKIPQIIYPDYEQVTYRESGWGLSRKEPHLNAKVVFITASSAVSYAESYMGYIEHYKLATIVGQPTAGTNGNVTYLKLPGHYSISWTGMRVVKHDDSQHHGIGIKPHVLVNRTLKGIREGRDEFLEKAIEIAESTN
ncbi:MAG: peptidase S41 [bacterium]|nr:peptidase S41 [bacterium]